jgi:hypothetical protein
MGWKRYERGREREKREREGKEGERCREREGARIGELGFFELMVTHRWRGFGSKAT